MSTAPDNPYAPPSADLTHDRRSEAVGCPRCAEPLEPAHATQTCPKCSLVVVLRAGCKLAANLEVPPPASSTIKTQAATAGRGRGRMRAMLEPSAIVQRSLDVIIGLIPTGSASVPYRDVWSLATWRHLDWALILMTTLVLVPTATPLTVIAINSPKMWIFAGPLLALAAAAYWRAIRVGVHLMRVCGTEVTLVLRFDIPFYRRARFLREALRRTGIEA